MRERYNPESHWLAVLNAVEAAPAGLTLRELATATGLRHDGLGALVTGAISRYPERIQRIPGARPGRRGRGADVIKRVEPSKPRERVTPESLSRQVYERGEPITAEQLHALHEVKSRQWLDVTPTICEQLAGAAAAIRSVAPEQHELADLLNLAALALSDLLDDVKTFAPITATAAAPGAADTNQVHGDRA